MDRTTWMRNVEAYSLIMAIVIVMLEIVYIFLPGHRMIEQTLEDLRIRNARLVDAQAALTGSMEDLEADLAIRRRSDITQPA